MTGPSSIPDLDALQLEPHCPSSETHCVTAHTAAINIKKCVHNHLVAPCHADAWEVHIYTVILNGFFWPLPYLSCIDVDILGSMGVTFSSRWTKEVEGRNEYAAVYKYVDW